MFNFLIKILDFVYRKKCYFCRTSFENTVMCQKCYDKIEMMSLSPIRIIRGINVYSSCYYEKEMQKLIRGVKYHNQKELAFYQAKFMYDYFVKIFDKSIDFEIIPVPLHKKRYKQRKYNHMELVANEIAKISGWTVNTKLIERIKETKPQYKLNTKQREENLKNAFKVFKEEYHDKKLLIIDDILTTGSTLSEIIKMLQMENIIEIVALTTSSVHGSSVNIK